MFIPPPTPPHHHHYHLRHFLFHNHFPTGTKTLRRRRKNVLILVSKTSYIGLKWKLCQLFFKTSLRRLLGDVLKTSSRRRPQDVFQKMSSRRLPEYVPRTSSRRCPQGVFQEMSSRPLPGDVLETSLRSLKTSGLSLVRAKDHLETIYGLSI